MSVCVIIPFLISISETVFFALKRKVSTENFLNSEFMNLKRNYAHEEILKAPPKPLVNIIFLP